MNKKTKWLILPPHTFVDHINASKLFLYNTETSSNHLITDDETISLIIELQQSYNLGSKIYSEEGSCNVYLKELISRDLLQLVEAKEKPIVFLPILNLQRDLEKGELSYRLSIMGSKTKFISGLFLYIDKPFIPDLANIDNIRINAIRQSLLYGLTDDCELIMGIEKVKMIFKSLAITSISIVDIISSISILTDANLSQLVRLASNYGYKIRIHTFIDNNNTDRVLKIMAQHKSIELSLYFDRYSEFDYQQFSSKSSKITTQASLIKYVYSALDFVDSDNIDMLPVYRADEVQMFRDNVFLTKQDILSNCTSMKEIMRNQKLNATCFGILDILSNGNVYPHGGRVPVSNISNKNYLLESVTSELVNNQSWRVTRDKNNCSNCQYRFICPPVSLLELQIEDIKACIL